MVSPLLLAQAAEITRESARDAARAELSEPEYAVGRPSLLDRAIEWVVGRITDAFAEIVRIVPGGISGVVLLVTLVVSTTVLIRLGLGPVPLRDALADRRRGARARTADDYRREADALAAGGRWKEAVRARFRALVRELEQRGVLDPRPGRTAGEIAGETAAAVPAAGAAVRAAADVFDAVWYGDRPAGPGEHDVVRAADEELAARRLAVTGAR